MRVSVSLTSVSFRSAKGRGRVPAIAALVIVTAIATLFAAMILEPGAALARERRLRPVAAGRSAQPDEPGEPYAAALLMEPVSGTVMFENNAHKPWPTASL